MKDITIREICEEVNERMNSNFEEAESFLDVPDAGLVFEAVCKERVKSYNPEYLADDLTMKAGTSPHFFVPYGERGTVRLGMSGLIVPYPVAKITSKRFSPRGALVPYGLRTKGCADEQFELADGTIKPLLDCTFFEVTQCLITAYKEKEDTEQKNFEKGIAFAKAKGLSADDIKYLCQWNNYSARDNWEEVEKQLGTAKKGV